MDETVSIIGSRVYLAGSDDPCFTTLLPVEVMALVADVTVDGAGTYAFVHLPWDDLDAYVRANAIHAILPRYEDEEEEDE